jgi:cytochrome c oxidase assembly factor CtaG
VARDEREPELPDVPRLDVADAARDEVVVEELHGPKSRLSAVFGSWVLNPLQVVPILVLGALYQRRALTLKLRGTPLPRRRVVFFWTGIALLLVALVSPIDDLAERHLFAFHMIQHLLLGDLAPLAVLAGVSGPLLQPALRYLHRLRPLAHPAVALPLWALDLYLWHLPFLYQAALHDQAIHALEHICFFTGGMLLWAPVLEPLPAPEWFGSAAKLGYIVVARLVTTVLANVFLWSGTVFYPFYDGRGRWGISPLHDQGIAGSAMLIEGSLVTIAAIAWLFLRMFSEGELRQELLERGLDPRSVKRAVRYGRAQELGEPR